MLWIFIAAFLAISALIAISYFITASKGSIGLTSEIATIIVFLIGALCYWGSLEIAAALGVGTAVLLSLKVVMRRLVGQVSEQNVLPPEIRCYHSHRAAAVAKSHLRSCSTRRLKPSKYLADGRLYLGDQFHRLCAHQVSWISPRRWSDRSSRRIGFKHGSDVEFHAAEPQQ